MKTLSITIELSSIALDTISQSLTPIQILTKVKRSLLEKFDVMGKYLNTRLNTTRQFDDTIELKEYQITFENHTLQLDFLYLKPRQQWEVKGFKFV